MRIREQPLITLVLVLALIGLVIACYLTYVHYNHDALICTTGGCETVQQSDYATITGIPVALFGVGMFLTLIVLALLRLMDRAFISFEHATIAAWVLVAAGVMY